MSPDNCFFEPFAALWCGNNSSFNRGIQTRTMFKLEGNYYLERVGYYSLDCALQLSVSMKGFMVITRVLDEEIFSTLQCVQPRIRDMMPLNFCVEGTWPVALTIMLPSV